MTRKRTCTARCWNAKGTKCRCICSGSSHGLNRIESALNKEQQKELPLKPLTRNDLDEIDRAAHYEAQRDAWRRGKVNG